MIPLILIVIGIFLIIHNYKKINREITSFEFTLNEEKENLNDYKLELGILRRDIGESLTELQQEIKTIKMNMNMVNDIEKEYDNILDRNIEDLEFNAEEEIMTKKESDINVNINLDKVNFEESIAKEQNEYQEVSSGVISEINFRNEEIFDEIIDQNQDIVNEITDNFEVIEDDNGDEEFFDEVTDKNNEVSNEFNKQHRITDLIKKNFTDEEICKALSISKGEVLLVRNLFKN